MKKRKISRTKLVLCGLRNFMENIHQERCDTRAFIQAWAREGFEYAGQVMEMRANSREITRVRRAIRQLKKAGLIELERAGHATMLRLTSGGVLSCLKEQMRAAQPLPAGQCCIVSYDIPEHLRAVRQEMRAFLRSCGFKIQHWSVWICEKEVVEPMKESLAYLGAGRWAHCYEAKLVHPTKT